MSYNKLLFIPHCILFRFSVRLFHCFSVIFPSFLIFYSYSPFLKAFVSESVFFLVWNAMYRKRRALYPFSLKSFSLSCLTKHRKRRALSPFSSFLSLLYNIYNLYFPFFFRSSPSFILPPTPYHRLPRLPSCFLPIPLSPTSCLSCYPLPWTRAAVTPQKNNVVGERNEWFVSEYREGKDGSAKGERERQW